MEWKVCPGFPDYEVSENGACRNIRTGRSLRSHLLDRYPRYSLQKDRKKYGIAAHRLVALAFIGPSPFDGAEVCHNDGNRAHCHFSNLRWGTHLDNVGDMIRHQSYIHKLVPREVREIRLLLTAGVNKSEIARKFNVHRNTVRLISCGERWAHLS
jgi:hypothetical protein